MDGDLGSVPAPQRGSGDTRRWPLEHVNRVAWTFVGVALAVVIVISTLAALQELVVPLVIAVVGAVVFAPAVDWFERRGVPRAIGALVAAAVVFGLSALVVWLVLVGITARADELGESLQAASDEIATLVDASGTSWAGFEPGLGALGSTVLQGAGAPVGTLLGSVAGALAGITLGLVMLFYLLKDGHRLLGQLLEDRPVEQAQQAERILVNAAIAVRRNSRGRSLLATMQAAVTFAAMALLGVPLPATIALVSFIGSFVPYLGAFVGGVFAVLMAMSAGGLPLAGWALVAVLVTNITLESLFEPRLVGGRLSLHPLVVLLATVAGGVMFGLLGLVLAAPAVAIGVNLRRELRSAGLGGPPSPSGDGSLPRSLPDQP